jgi:hypothetical protein
MTSVGSCEKPPPRIVVLSTKPLWALLGQNKQIGERHHNMGTPEEAKRAFETARASMRRRKHKELAVAIAFGLVCSCALTLLIYLLNLRPKF